MFKKKSIHTYFSWLVIDQFFLIYDSRRNMDILVLMLYMVTILEKGSKRSF